MYHTGLGEDGLLMLLESGRGLSRGGTGCERVGRSWRVEQGSSTGGHGVESRHATSVRQGNWFSVAIGPVSNATQ